MAIIKKAIGTVGIMWNDSDPRQFVNSLAPLLLYSQSQLCEKHEYIHFISAPMSYHELARGYLVDNSEGEFLLSLDCDHQFAPDLLTRLLHYRAKVKARVISGIYTFKFPPHAPVANVWGDKGQVIALGAWHPDTDLLQVGPVGGGCLLVDRSVFNEIKQVMHQPPFNIIQGLSEDYSFCKRCKDLNIPIWLAMNVECHHLAPRNVLHLKDYVAQFAPAFSAAAEADQEKLKGMKVGIDPK